MIRVALLLVVMFGALHLAGAREYVAMLSGTHPAGPEEVLFGVAYVLAWFGAILVAPILGIAGVIARVAQEARPTPSAGAMQSPAASGVRRGCEEPSRDGVVGSRQCLASLRLS